MREATKTEIQNWDKLVLANPDGGEILQTRAWGEFKRRHGWTPRYYIYSLGKAKLAVLFLSKKVPLMGELWYCPKGPGVASAEQLVSFADLTERKAPKGVFLLKVEPELVQAETNTARLKEVEMFKAPFDLHISQATVKIDLKPSKEDLLAGFKQKTRYNIRLAERLGVRVRPVKPEPAAMEAMYKLIAATQSRAGFMVRSKEYCFDYWRAQVLAGQGQLFLAEYEGRVIAGAFVTVLGQKAWYKDGGSLREHSKLMAPYLLQWKIMQWLKVNRVTSYDLLGIPRKSEAETSPLKGLYQFKSGFNGMEQEFIGTWDVPFAPLRYRVWNQIAERLVLAYETKIKHNLWY